MSPYSFRVFAALMLLMLTAINSSAQKTIGIFDKNTDVGNAVHKGSVPFNPSTEQNIISGSGINIWGTRDEFHYAWKKIKGNFILQTRAAFTGKGTDPHRKIGWMVRSTLDTSSPMVIATIHGDSKKIVL